MANNIILTPSIFVKGILMNLGGYLSVARNMTSEYSEEFTKKIKPGSAVRVRKPQRFIATTGLTYQPQPLSNTETTITVGDVTGVHYEWDGVERTLKLEDAQERYFKPAAIAIASRINANAAQYVAQNTFSAVGTPGTVPSSIDTYLDAGDKIVGLGLPPQEELHCIVSRKMSSSFVKGNKVLYNPVGQISEMFKNGEIVDDTLGYTFHRDQMLYTQTIGPQGGVPLVNGANQASDGGNNANGTLVTKGWTAAAASRLVVGDRFTISNVFSVHPQTRASTNDLQMFVVKTAFSSDGAGNGTITMFPAITPSGQYQNVTVSPLDSAAITVFGAAGTSSTQGLLMHRNSFAFVSVPLATPESGKGVMASAMHKDDDTGITLAMVQFFDGVNRVEGTRFDTLTGFGPLYPEMACVIAS